MKKEIKIIHGKCHNKKRSKPLTPLLMDILKEHDQIEEYKKASRKKFSLMNKLANAFRIGL